LSKKVYWVITNDEDEAERWMDRKLKDQTFASKYIPLILSDISTIEHLEKRQNPPPQGVFLKGWDSIPTIKKIILKLQELSNDRNYALDRMLVTYHWMHNDNATLSNPNGPLTVKPIQPPAWPQNLPSPVVGMIVVDQQDGSQRIFDGKAWVKI